MTTGKAPGATIVGTGFGVFTHLRALRKAGFEVRSLVGRDRAKAEQRAKLFGVPDVHTSLAAALQDPAVQVVTVATPPTRVMPTCRRLTAFEGTRMVPSLRPMTTSWEKVIARREPLRAMGTTGPLARRAASCAYQASGAM